LVISIHILNYITKEGRTERKSMHFLLMAIKKCIVWQLGVYTKYCIITALHGVVDMIGSSACKASKAPSFARNHVRRGSMSSVEVVKIYTV
jgi:hypothetical protein